MEGGNDKLYLDQIITVGAPLFIMAAILLYLIFG